MKGRGAIWIAISLLAALVALALPAAAPAEHSALELITTGPGPEGNGSGDLLQVSQDGQRVLFESSNALVAEDTDDCTDPDLPEDVTGCPDTYERFDGVTSLVTTGPTDPHPQNQIHRFLAGSPNFDRVLFDTISSLVAQDTHPGWDLYGRIDGTTSLLSPSWPALSGETWFITINVSRDGQRAFVATPNRLLPEDTDNCIDYYELSSGTFKLMTPNVRLIGPFFCASVSKFFTSADGTRFFWRTTANATSEDPDVIQGNDPAGPAEDIYETFNGQVRLVSTGPADTAEGGYLRSGAAVSADGSKVVFTTDETLVAQDTDQDSDVYERSNGQTRLVVPPAAGDSSPAFGFRGMSTDGSRVIGLTDVRLAPEDSDAQTDLYAIVDGSAELLSIGTSGGNGGFAVQWTAFWPDDSISPLWSANIPNVMSQDGRVVTFSTAEKLVPEDTDQTGDIYANVNGVVRLISTGTNDFDQGFDGDPWRGLFVSPDGSRIFFQDSQPFAQEDDDAAVDVYEWHAGVTTLVPNGVPTPTDVRLAGHSSETLADDGSRVFIGTEDPLTPNDTDGEWDLYGVGLNGPPDCDAVTATPRRLWPPDGRFVRVGLRSTDPDDADLSFEITGVTQDEPVRRWFDAWITRTHSKVRLRAQRLNRDGRVYRLAFEATDGAGGTCDGTVSVSVPRHKHRPAVDSAPPSYDSTG